MAPALQKLLAKLHTLLLQGETEAEKLAKAAEDDLRELLHLFLTNPAIVGAAHAALPALEKAGLEAVTSGGMAAIPAALEAAGEVAFAGLAAEVKAQAAPIVIGYVSSKLNADPANAAVPEHVNP